MSNNEIFLLLEAFLPVPHCRQSLYQQASLSQKV